MREWKTEAQQKRLLREAEDERYVLIGSARHAPAELAPLYTRLFAALAKAKKGKVKQLLDNMGEQKSDVRRLTRLIKMLSARDV